MWMGPGARPLAPIQALGCWAIDLTSAVSVFASSRNDSCMPCTGWCEDHELSHMSNVPRVQWGQVLNYVAYPLVFHTKKATCTSCLGRRTNEGEKNSVQGPSVRCAAQMRRGLYSLWATRSHGKFYA